MISILHMDLTNKATIVIYDFTMLRSFQNLLFTNWLQMTKLILILSNIFWQAQKLKKPNDFKYIFATKSMYKVLQLLYNV